MCDAVLRRFAFQQNVRQVLMFQFYYCQFYLNTWCKDVRNKAFMRSCWYLFQCTRICHHFPVIQRSKTVPRMELSVGKFKHEEAPGSEVIQIFSCSTQLSINFFLFINVKMPTIAF